MTNGLQIIVSLLRDIANSLKNSGGTKKIEDMIQSLVDTHIISSVNIQGYTFMDGYKPEGYADIFTRQDKLARVVDDQIVSVASTPAQLFYKCPNLVSVELLNLREVGITGLNLNFLSQCNVLKTINLPKLKTLASDYAFSYNPELQEIYLPEVEGRVNERGFAYNCPKLKVLRMDKGWPLSPYAMLSATPQLILLCFGKDATISMNVSNWIPTEALLTNSTSLVEQGEEFSSNREKLLYNIREYIAKTLPSRNGMSALTITFSSEVKAAILDDTTTTFAFTSKNWTIA